MREMSGITSEKNKLTLFILDDVGMLAENEQAMVAVLFPDFT